MWRVTATQAPLLGGGGDTYRPRGRGNRAAEPCQARNVAYFIILVMGGNAAPAILRSADINRSSQDTQQPRASPTEPVRHGAWGAGGAQQGTILC